MDQSTNLTSMILRTNQGPGKHEEHVKIKKIPTVKVSTAFVHLQSNSVPDRGRLELLLFSSYLHELSRPADHLTELHACCEMLKEEGRGAPSILKIQKLWTAVNLVCSSKCKSHRFSKSQQCCASQLSVKACDIDRVSRSWKGCDEKTTREQETEKWRK